MKIQVHTTHEKPDETKEFVMIRKKWFEDKRAGFISKDEFDILLYIVDKTNPFNGYALLSHSEVGLAIKKSANHTTRLMGELKKKRYIYFSRHSGSRASFQVMVDGYRFANKEVWVDIAPNFLEEKTRAHSEHEAVATPEPPQFSEENNQR